MITRKVKSIPINLQLQSILGMANGIVHSRFAAPLFAAGFPRTALHLVRDVPL